MNTLSQLQQHIEGANYLNVERLNILLSIKDQFKAMEGAKVQLSGGDKSQKWTLKGDYKQEKKTVNGLNVNVSFQYYFVFSHSFVILNTKVCINGGSYDNNTAFTHYVEASDYIGRLENQILKDVNDIDGCIENATAEANNPLNEDVFNQQKQAYKEALDTANKLKDAVSYRLRDYLPKY